MIAFASGIDAPSTSAPSQSVPPVSCAISRAAISAAGKHVRGSTTRSNLWLASVRTPCARLAERTRAGSQAATSSTIFVVASLTSESLPPMTPASEVAFDPSATTISPAFSVRACPSSVVSDSPSEASRMTNRWPSNLSRSNTWLGLPSSRFSQLVSSTALLMDRWPTLSSSDRSQSGLGPILAFRVFVV